MNIRRTAIRSAFKLALLATCALPGRIAAQVPFLFVNDRADVHTMAYFDGHPEYEAVEAYIYYEEGGEPFIRAILSRRDGSQADFVNRERKREGPDSTASSRQAAVRPISFSLSPDGLSCELSISLPDGQDLRLSYHSSAPPDKAYGGLTDVGNHSPEGGLPLIYREASSMGDEGCRVTIGPVSYPIQTDPGLSNPFFTAREAYLSYGMQNLIISTFDRSIPKADLTAIPPEGLATIYSGQGATASTRIDCSPAFPDAREMRAGEERTVEFKAIFQGKAVARGRIIVTRGEGAETEIRLLPTEPKWAAGTRDMRVSVTDLGDSLRIVSRMDRPRSAQAKSAQAPASRREPILALGAAMELRMDSERYAARAACRLSPVAQLVAQGGYSRGDGIDAVSVSLGLSSGTYAASRAIRVYGGPEITFHFPSAISREGPRFCGSVGGFGGVEFFMGGTASLFLEFGGSYGYSAYAEPQDSLFGAYFRGGLILLRF